MVGDGLSGVVGGLEEVGLYLMFERGRWIRVLDGQREGVPESRSGSYCSK